ncbi:GNAT family N-acetyltransferase [Amycolatopsis solani]|uniref:GNAT family N-acetyltransferase n=1 Tax=Amycolatopsis solani TaxID=3028615 RepID=UPI0025B2172C|nr:GNAT family N-acetyltransferase [Amycolatopsis sp. MEP2-6]
MSGWAATGPRSLADELVRRGARLIRATHRMTCDLSASLPLAEWACEDAPQPLRFTPLDLPVDDLLPAWRAAYAPGHPDYREEYEDAAVLRRRFDGLVAGTAYGPLSPLSGLVCDDGVVVAGVVLNHLPGDVPWGGLLITDLFRHPSYPGSGTVLLRRTLARAAAAAVEVVGLVVTDGNPARRLYERHGFAVFESPVTVRVP